MVRFRMKVKRFLLIKFVFLFSAWAFGQIPQAKFEDFKLQSELMGRMMPYRVVYPTDYFKSNEKRYSVIYLLHGLSGNYKNWTEKTNLLQYATEHNFLIVMVEGENGWYVDTGTQPRAFYETYIVKELIPEIDKKFRTLSDRKHRIIAGLSMGGYGAIKFGLKYPEKFGFVGSFSGALGIATADTDKMYGWIAETVKRAFGDSESPVRRNNDIFAILRGLSSDQLSQLPFIYLDCGTEDFLFRENQEFMTLLVEKKVKHEYRHLPGAHTWTYWDSQIFDFLRLAEKLLKEQEKTK